MTIPIDVNFDFTTDTPRFWDSFWDSELGTIHVDPDSKSPMLREYHKILWSKSLPNGEVMELTSGRSQYYLKWNDFYFGSDSITATFRYVKYQRMLEQVAKTVPDYKAFVEDYLHRLYRIGGMIIFPMHKNSINQTRGTNARISDRFDLTLECIRRHYVGEVSPLSNCLTKDKAFFDLFLDFQGYVDFFFLQDCVTDDYKTVKFWLGNGDFDEDPRPNTVDGYLQWVENQLDFVEKRNARIEAFFDSSKRSFQG